MPIRWTYLWKRSAIGSLRNPVGTAIRQPSASATPAITPVAPWVVGGVGLSVCRLGEEHVALGLLVGEDVFEVVAESTDGEAGVFEKSS